MTQTKRTQPAGMPEPGAQLEKTLEEMRAGPHYRNYLRARDAVLACLAEMDTGRAEPSAYWREELGGFDYMLDASPLIVEKLREHCHHITGDASYRYRQHHAIVADPFERKLARLSKLDQSNLFVPEAELLGGFGHPIDGSLINVDALKFFEVMIALDRAGFIDEIKNGRSRSETWLEIGAGWGGFGRVVKTLFPSTTYVVVDLPQTMLFSATYLLSAFPDARFAIYPEVSLKEIGSRLREFDFVFLPHYVFDDAELDIDLAINMVSFQEMTSEQVAGYLKNLSRMGCSRLYSLNRDRSSYNSELSAVSTLITEHFAKPRKIGILPYSYPTLVPPKPPPRRVVREFVARMLGRRPKKPSSTLKDYRHLVAERG